MTQLELRQKDEAIHLMNSNGYTIFKDQIIANAEWSVIHTGEIASAEDSNPTTSKSMILAIKMPKSRQSAQMLLEEAEILGHLRTIAGHEEFVVNFIGFDPSNGAVILEKMDISLQHYVKYELERIDQRRAALAVVFPDVAKQLVCSLAYIHGVGQIVHGDVKPSNILLKKISVKIGDSQSTGTFPYRAVLADFGSSRLMIDGTKSKCGSTREFMAPESMTSTASEAPSTPEGDVWAMGITLLTIITGRTPYSRLSWPAMYSVLREGEPGKEFQAHCVWSRANPSSQFCSDA